MWLFFVGCLSVEFYLALNINKFLDIKSRTRRLPKIFHYKLLSMTAKGKEALAHMNEQTKELQALTC